MVSNLPPKSILLLAANPQGTRTLRLQEEEREIKERLRLSGYGKVPINSSGATRPRDIQQAMLDFKPQIVHFSGHGAGEEGLVFEDVSGGERLVSSEALANLFGLFSGRIECVVLNACHSKFQAEGIAQHIKYVIGTNQTISDRAAIEFAVGFYTALGAGESIEFAYKLGCNAIQLGGIPEHLTPILYKREEVSPLTTPSFQRSAPDIIPQLSKSEAVTPKENRVALVVGINQYPFIESLTTSANDAEAIAQTLEQYGGFRVQRLPASYIDGALRVDPNKLLKKSELKAAISYLFSPNGSNVPDTALFYFSGHGLRESLGSLTDGYLATSDVNPEDDEYGLSLPQLRRLLRISPVQNQIVFLDCCYSGELLDFTELEVHKKSQFLIAASQEFESAYTNASGKHGLFTEALLKGLDPNNYPEDKITNHTLIETIRRELENSPQIPIWFNPEREIFLTSRVFSESLPNASEKSTLGQARKARIDWDGAPDTSHFLGREDRLQELENWIIRERCRGVLILAMGGMGKSCLAAKLTERIQSHFNYVIWRSLKDAPLADEVLDEVLKFITENKLTDLPETLEAKASYLLELLRKYRCLIIIDNVESILDSTRLGMPYKQGYENYRFFLRQMLETQHQSCVLMTSREQSPGFRAIEGTGLPVHCLRLVGLPAEIAGKLLESKGLSKSNGWWKELAKTYSGNPLALQLVASLILDVYNGDIEAFLAEEDLLFRDMRDLLEQQFRRLSESEKELMYWLAIEREPISFRLLRDEILD